MRAFFAVLIMSLVGGLALLAACSQGGNDSSFTPRSGANTHTGEATCDVHNDNCPCDTEGALDECGVVHRVTVEGRAECANGFRRCVAHKWSQCDALERVTTQKNASLHLAGFVPEAGTGGGCTICDPRCAQAGQNYDGGGITGSYSPPFDAAVNGPPNPAVLPILQAAGINADAGIYHELLPDASAFDPLTVSTIVNTVDVYFLLNSTASTQASITALSTEIPNVVTAVSGSIANVGYGIGRFTNYQAWPYASQSNGNTVYNNMSGVSTNSTLMVNTLQAMPTNAGGVCPGDPSCFQNVPFVVAQSTGTALYAMATNESLIGWARFTNFAQPTWWYDVFAHYGSGPGAFQAPFIASNPSCPVGAIGAACFRPGAFHIVMVLQDAPMNSGPGGSFPYYQFKPRYFPFAQTADFTTENSWYWYYSSSLGGTPAVPALPVDNGNAQTRTIPAARVGTPNVEFGSIATGGANNYQLTTASVYDASAKMTCTINGPGPIATGSDVSWNFTIPAGGGNRRYWFDTVGTSYDTVLYIQDRNTNKIMACADDTFAWLSAQNIGLAANIQAIAAKNSAIVGDLPPGDYRLVLDKFDTTAFTVVPGVIGTTSMTGSYEINMWMDITDPRMAGNPRGTGVTTPGYTQMLNAVKAPGLDALVMGIEMSGVSCGQAPSSWEKNWSRWSLEHLARDTGAVVGGVPQVFSIKQNGTPGPVSGMGTPQCPAGANLGTVVSNAIQNLTGNLAQGVTVRIVDADNGTDFDGTAGVSAGATVLTPNDVDDATFVSSIVANPSAGCSGPLSQMTRMTGSGVSAAGFTSCNAGATPNITFNFSIPPTVALSSGPQIFRFNVDIYFGTIRSSTTPVVLVVPPNAFAAADFNMEVDTPVCRYDQTVQWSTFSWNTAGCGATPCIPLQNPPTVNNAVDANIAFYLTASNSPTFAGATEIPTPFFIAQNASQIGAFDLNTFLTSRPDPIPKYLRIRARLVPTQDRQQTPRLTSWNVTTSCIDSQ